MRRQTMRRRETVKELQETESQLVEKIFELEAIESHLQQELVEKEDRGLGDEEADNPDHCEKLNNEILKMQYESSILIFEATMKEKELEIEHERGLTQASRRENATLHDQLDSLQSDMRQLRVEDEENLQKLKDVDDNNRQLSYEVQSLRSANETLLEKEEQLQSTLQ